MYIQEDFHLMYRNELSHISIERVLDFYPRYSITVFFSAVAVHIVYLPSDYPFTSHFPSSSTLQGLNLARAPTAAHGVSGPLAQALVLEAFRINNDRTHVEDIERGVRQ